MKLRFKPLDLRLANPWRTSRKSSVSVRVVFVELYHRGICGLGEAAPISRYNESTETVLSFFKRVDPRMLSFEDFSASFQYLKGLSAEDYAAKAAVNTALLDGAAKAAGKTVHEFLNLGFQEGKYVTSFTIGIATPNIIRKKVQAAAEFPVLKMKVGVSEDESNLQALREIAPRKPLRLDANEGWPTKEHALEIIERFAADQHIEFIEQPLPASVPLEDFHWLKERSPLPIFADESFHHPDDASVIAECFHGVNVKLAKAGGITGALEALRAARNHGLKTMLGCMIESSLGISAAAHLSDLCDYWDLDGSLLVNNDPFDGVTANKGLLSFANAKEKVGLQVAQSSTTVESLFSS